MRVRTKDGKEVCTNCGKDWAPAENRPMHCNDCFCPQSYCTMIDDVAFHLSGMFKELLGEPPSAEALVDLKQMLEEQLSMAVPPMTFEELCEKQPIAKRLFA